MASLLQTTDNTRAILPGSLRYIRSDVPDHLNDADVQWLRENQVRTVVDLREPEELAQKPCKLRDLMDFTYYNLPISGGNRVPATPDDVPGFYLAMLDETMAQVLAAIENARTNVLYFCNAGKDRTGVVSALLLRRQGADDETIIADYLLTAENLRERIALFAKGHPQLDINVLTPCRRYMQEFLASSAQWNGK